MLINWTKGGHRAPAGGLRAALVGFSLIEMMIVLVIIAVLLMIAVPSYQQSMKKSRRADAMRDLVELVSKQERYYAQHSVYTDDISSPDGLNFNKSGDSEDSDDSDDSEAISSEGHYTLSAGTCVRDEVEVDISTCYVLHATPLSDGLQKDDGCGTLSIDSLGQRSASGPLGDTCW